MRAAFRIAPGRKGPVLVDIPKDITAASCEFTPAPELIRTVTYYNEEDAGRSDDQRVGAPHRLLGGGVRSAAAASPCATCWKDRHARHLHPDGCGCSQLRRAAQLRLLAYGCYAANKAIDEADLVIAGHAVQ